MGDFFGNKKETDANIHLTISIHWADFHLYRDDLQFAKMGPTS